MTTSNRSRKNELPRQQSLGSYVLIIAVSAAMGAGVTWLVMSQRSTSEFHTVQSTPPAAFSPTPDVSGLAPGDAAIVLGNFAYDHQRWPAAIRQYQQAIANGVDNPDVRTDLGNAFRFSGQPRQALDQYTIAQKLNPQHENSLFNEISLFTEVLNEPARAIPLCEEFIRRFSSSDKLPAVRQQLARAKQALP
jgi:tetratricopeptide (TPR) repeat protein